MAINIGTTITVGTEYEYKIVDLISSGGFGQVFKAARLRPTPGAIAVKVPTAAVMAHPVWSRKFEREARILANVAHPNVVKIVGFWTFPDGDMALAQELVPDAQELGPYVAAHPGEAASLLLQALYALRAIHGDGSRKAAVHRDLSPRNMLVDARANLKLIDFGLAKEDPRDTTVLTVTDEWFGTHGCMAPEQMSDCAEVDGRADLYALGRSFAAVIQQRKPLHAQPHRLPSPWKEICEKLTEHDVDQRCATASAALEFALAAFAETGTAISNFGIHVDEMLQHSMLAAWPASCQAHLDGLPDFAQADLELVAGFDAAVFGATEFDPRGVLDKLEGCDAISAFDASFIDFDDLDVVGRVYRKLYPFLDAVRKETCFRRVVHLALRGHRFALMQCVRAIYSSEPDPAVGVQLAIILDAEDPSHVIEGRGIIPGRP